NNPKIYTNSENSINWILSNLTGTNLPDIISLFKDKARFRELLKKIYPDFYFKKISYNELDKLNADEYKYPIVIKPSVGFLSFGVYTVYEKKELDIDRKSTRLNSSHVSISYAVFCLKKKKNK